MNTLDLLIKNLSKLPGIGRKSAARMAYHLLKADADYLASLAESIGTLKERIRECSVCHAYTESDVCEICANTQRDGSIICVLEQSQDISTIESTHEFKGLYHILKGVISPLDGIGPSDLTIPSLMKRIEKDNVKEVILATNPTVEGDTTALYILKMLSEKPVEVTRLASGLPVGGDLEYADRLTLARSLKGRSKLSF